jgi:hypothetical protein
MNCPYTLASMAILWFQLLTNLFFKGSKATPKRPRRTEGSGTDVEVSDADGGLLEL